MDYVTISRNCLLLCTRIILRFLMAVMALSKFLRWGKGALDKYLLILALFLFIYCGFYYGIILCFYCLYTIHSERQNEIVNNIFRILLVWNGKKHYVNSNKHFWNLQIFFLVYIILFEFLFLKLIYYLQVYTWESLEWIV